MDIYAKPNTELLVELGQRLRQQRLNRNLSQVELARMAGIHPNALRHLENGGDTTLGSLLRLLRALRLLGGFEQLLPAPQASPVALAQAAGHLRLRAGRPRTEAAHG